MHVFLSWSVRIYVGHRPELVLAVPLHLLLFIAISNYVGQNANKSTK